MSGTKYLALGTVYRQQPRGANNQISSPWELYEVTQGVGRLVVKEVTGLRLGLLELNYLSENDLKFKKVKKWVERRILDEKKAKAVITRKEVLERIVEN